MDPVLAGLIIYTLIVVAFLIRGAIKALRRNIKGTL